MPNIFQFESPVDSLNPSNLGPSAIEQEARIQRIDANEAGNAIGSGIATAGNTLVQQVAKHQAFQELLTGGQVASNLQLNLSNAWDDFSKEHPNDPAAQREFLDNQLEPALTKFQDGFQTEGARQWALSQSDNIRNHFFTRTSADLASQASSAVSSGLEHFSNAQAATVAGNPTQLDQTIAANKLYINALVKNSNLSPDAAARVNGDILDGLNNTAVKAGLMTQALKNPAAFGWASAAGKFDKYNEFLKPGEMDTLNRTANAALKAGQEADKAAAVQQNALDKATFNAAAVKQSIEAAQVAPDGTITYPNPVALVLGPNGLAHTPGVKNLDPAWAREAIAAYSAVNRDAASGAQTPNDPATYDDFQSRAALDPADPRALTKLEIDQARASGHINTSAFTIFNHMVADRDPTKAQDEKVYQQVLASVKPLIWPTPAQGGLGFAASAYGQRYVQFTQDFRNYYNKERASGISSSDLLNPSSKSYILNTFPIKGYQLNAEDAQKLAPITNPEASGIIPPAPGIEDAAARKAAAGISTAPADVTDFFSDFSPFHPSTLAPAKPKLYKPGMSMDDLAKQVQ